MPHNQDFNDLICQEIAAKSFLIILYGIRRVGQTMPARNRGDADATTLWDWLYLSSNTLHHSHNDLDYGNGYTGAI